VRQLFAIEVDGDVKLQDDTFLLIPEMRELYEGLGSDFVRYVVLMADYKSPYKQLLHGARQEEVCDDIWKKEPKKIKELKNPLIISAIAKYKKLQYDPLVEQYQVYTEKIAEFNQWLREMPITKDNAEMLGRVMKAQTDIRESREELMQLILKKEEESKMMGGGEASLLEEMLG
jgi:hypothetical protein